MTSDKYLVCFEYLKTMKNAIFINSCPDNSYTPPIIAADTCSICDMVLSQKEIPTEYSLFILPAIQYELLSRDTIEREETKIHRKSIIEYLDNSSVIFLTESFDPFNLINILPNYFRTSILLYVNPESVPEGLRLDLPKNYNHAKKLLLYGLQLLSEKNDKKFSEEKIQNCYDCVDDIIEKSKKMTFRKGILSTSDILLIGLATIYGFLLTDDILMRFVINNHINSILEEEIKLFDAFKYLNNNSKSKK